MTSAGDLLNGGLEVIKRRPGSVLAWAAIHAVLALIVLTLVMPMTLAQMRDLANFEPGSGRFTAMQGMGAFQGISWLMSFAGYFVSAVLMCGAFRVILRPDEPSFASLRVGWDELRIFGIIAVLAFASPFVLILFGLLVMLLGFVIGFALQSIPWLQILLIVILALAALAAVLYVWVRITLIFPLTFMRQRLVVDEAWKLSGGRFWTLFLPYLVVTVVIAIVFLVMLIPVFGQIFAELGGLPTGVSDADMRDEMLAIFERLFGQPLGMAGLFIGVSALMQAVSTALYGGIMATAAAGFLHDDGLKSVRDVFD